MTCSIESPFSNHESMGKIPNIPCSLLADDPSSLFRTRTRPKASPTTVTIPAKPTKNPIRRSLFILYRKCRGTLENTKWKLAVNNPIIGKRLSFFAHYSDNRQSHNAYYSTLKQPLTIHKSENCSGCAICNFKIKKSGYIKNVGCRGFLKNYWKLFYLRSTWDYGGYTLPDSIIIPHCRALWF